MFATTWHRKRETDDKDADKRNATSTTYRNVRVRQVDHANFIPLIAFTNGVLSPSFDKFLQNMAHHKVKNHPELTYNQVITAYRARLSFVIARSTFNIPLPTRKSYQ